MPQYYEVPPSPPSPPPLGAAVKGKKWEKIVISPTLPPVVQPKALTEEEIKEKEAKEKQNKEIEEALKKKKGVKESPSPLPTPLEWKGGNRNKCANYIIKMLSK